MEKLTAYRLGAYKEVLLTFTRSDTRKSGIEVELLLPGHKASVYANVDANELLQVLIQGIAEVKK